MEIVKITSANFEAEVKNFKKPVLLDFFANWCGPCKMLAPVLEEIAAETDEFKIGKINVDEEGELAREFGISERFIGLTIVALGTSLPELFTSVVAARKGNADIAIGNIVGSNIFNILFVVGLSALITPVPFAKEFIFDTAIAIAAAVLLFLCCFRDRKLSRAGGITMLISYASYFVVIL